MQARRPAYLALGLCLAWLAGLARYWDDPGAAPWQRSGIGSVAYVFAFAAFLWAILAPLRPRNGSPANVLLFVALTSPPAYLYAIPVERFLSAPEAREANAWLLAVVAAWRVALLAVFLRRVAGVKGWDLLFATLLPLSVLVTALCMLNLNHVVVRFMGGIRPEELTPHDTAYEVVSMLSIASVLLLPLLLIGYAASVYEAHHPPSPPRPPRGPPPPTEPGSDREGRERRVQSP